MNATEIAQKRKEEIEYSKARIEKKVKDMPDDKRVPGWKKRLSEYEKSMELIEFTLKTGRPVKLKGEETENGVTVNVPAGKLNAEGK